ncbi:hypothetical protein AEP_00861 [Curvibacter sp. AEP1-3]|nr:hypothetical protein AEP_00861 [Curvibacter sp. AEP1-3]
MRERWKSISNVDAEFEGKSEEVYAFFGQLELISLLVSKKAFDKEIVYNFWWRYFDEPLRVKALNTWLQIERESDSEMFIHYCDLCKEWAKRIDREQGRQIR